MYLANLDFERRESMKKRFKSFIMSCFLLVFAFLLMPVVKADAAAVQTKATTSSITVKWDAKEDALNYKVYVGKDYSSLKLYKTLKPSVTSVTIKKLPAGCERYVKIAYEYSHSYNPSKKFEGFVSSVFAKTIPGKVTGVKQERWYYYAKSFNATWKKFEGADGYQYIVKTSNGKKKASGIVKYNGNSLSVDKISNSMVYTVQVRAYVEINGKKQYGAWSAPGYFFTQPQITKAQVSKNKLTVKWDKVTGATGYDIYVSTKKESGYKKVKSVGKNTSFVTITKLAGKSISAKKQYYVYVISKKKVGKTTYTSGMLYYWIAR